MNVELNSLNQIELDDYALFLSNILVYDYQKTVNFDILIRLLAKLTLK